MKRPFFQDPRLSVIPDSYFIGARVLDVGCNEGWVTCEIGEWRVFSLSNALVVDGVPASAVKGSRQGRRRGHR